MWRRVGRTFVAAVLAVVLAALLLEGVLEVAARVVGSRRAGEVPVTAAIIVYGDSTPYGFGNEVRFSDEVARAGGVAVANRSWPGLNSTQVARIVHEDLGAASPRIMIVMAGVNDGWNIEDVPSALLGAAASWRQRLPRLRTLRLLAIGRNAGLGRTEYDTADAPGWSRREETARLLPNESIKRIQSASYAAIRADAGARGTHVLFLGYQAEGYNHVADLAEEVLRTEHGDAYVPLRDLFVVDGVRRMIQADEFHPTDDGQRAIAKRVLESLQERNWLRELGERTRSVTDAADREPGASSDG